MGLHLGWIPNEPGLRPRDYDQPRPRESAPDPAKVAALQAAQHARALWARLLIVVGLLALLLFGPIAAFAHVRWAWAVGAGLALCAWLPVVLMGRNRRRAASHLATDQQQAETRHAAELTQYEAGKARWAQAEAERVATAPRWLQVASHEDTTRLDVFGGTGSSRQNLVTGLGWELLRERAVIVLDLSQDRVADGLLAAAARAGISLQDYELPGDLAATPLLAGLSGDQIASLIVEVVHADDASATAAGRATDLMILRKITGVLGADVSLGRLHAALTVLLDDQAGAAGPFTDQEQAGLQALFGPGLRHQVAGSLVRLAAVVEPLSTLGTAVENRAPARLTCLSLADGPRDVAADLTAALVVQWVTRAVSSADGRPAGDTQPAVILAGADEQSTRHLARLTAVCERYGVPLVRAFSRLTEESARHLDTRHTAFLRLATRPEALRAAEHIGLERRFVAGRLAQRHSVSRSRTRTTSESVTHTTGRTEGEANTHTVGTTSGQSTSETRVPRHNPQQNLSVNIEDRPAPGRRDPGNSKSPSPERGRGEPDSAGSGRRQERDSGGDSRPRGGGSGGGGGGEGGSRKISVTQASGEGKPQVDIIRTKTQFSARQESDATTKSWSTTEETSKTSTTAQSRTDGVSVGDEISYELVYDHQVQPETLMALPEDQMLAPHVTESLPASGPVAAGAVAAGTAAPGTAAPGAAAPRAAAPGAADQAVAAGPRPAAVSKMVALVIDPAVVGSDPVAPVRPGEIPAFEPPAPQISAQVPDYRGVPRPPARPESG